MNEYYRIFEFFILINYFVIDMSKEDIVENGKYEKNPKLFITNLPPDMPEDQLKTDIEPLFEKFGAIKCVNVKKHKSGQYSYCFLEFEKSEDAIRAI